MRLLIDATDESMVSALRKLAADSQQDDEALFYFGGHAIDHCSDHHFFGIREGPTHAGTEYRARGCQGVTPLSARAE